MTSVAGLLSIAMLLAGAAQAQSPEVSIEDAAPVAEDSGTAAATFTVTLTQPTPIVYGDPHTGMYHLGPVDFAETQWHNACAPGGGYVTSLRDATGLGGEYLAGVSNLYAQGGGICDSCLLINTALGHSIIARIVTYGDTGPEDLDVSPSVYAAINEGEWPRTMTWQLVKCPDTGTLAYEFQTASSQWWTSFWVRNQRVPIEKVEVQSQKHPTFYQLRRETDGTLNCDDGFGTGSFTLRLTAVDGQVITDTFPGFTPGGILTSIQQFW